MSDFNLAMPCVLQHEGGFVDNARDPGGATHFGISLRFLQQINPDATVHDIDLLSEADAINIYQQLWWNRYHYAAIDAQCIATKVLDLAINMGCYQAHLCLQRAIRAATGVNVVEDGILGEESLRAINAANPIALLAAFKSEAAGFYRSLRQTQFEKGWLSRAYD